MMYNGKDMDLAEYVATQKKEYKGRPVWMWEDEGMLFAVLDYHSSMGEFSEKDLQTLNELFGDNAAEIIAMCEEN